MNFYYKECSKVRKTGGERYVLKSKRIYSFSEFWHTAGIRMIESACTARMVVAPALYYSLENFDI